ncbi:MAG: Holliday junction resolvase RuvX [Clostridia bacterium]|nr:Holliday junction resolvase RuvX [Clostridia bacterium]MBR5428141.1 Holliday junction resolvase RuvX [Clostridia bacterium]
MIILSVDYGDARTGVAVCDKNEILASPVCMIAENEPERLAEKLAETARERRAERIVVGLPRNMDGSEGFRAEACRAFAALLAEKTGLETVLRDERLTTVSAHRALSDAGVFGKKRKQSVDALSAVMILQDYIDSRKS